MENLVNVSYMTNSDIRSQGITTVQPKNDIHRLYRDEGCKIRRQYPER